VPFDGFCFKVGAKWRRCRSATTQSTLDSSRGAKSVRQVCVISQACDAHRSLIITLYGDGNPCRAVAPFGWEHSLGG
jgi:hypothetical protein